MNPQVTQASPHSAAWVTFTYASFFASVGMVGIGVLFAPVDIWIKAYFAMGAALLVRGQFELRCGLRLRRARAEQDYSGDQQNLAARRHSAHGVTFGQSHGAVNRHAGGPRGKRLPFAANFVRHGGAKSCSGLAAAA